MTQQELNIFYSKVSFAGMLFLYAIKLSYNKQIAFDREHLAKEVNVASADYLYGFLVACSSFDIVNYNTKDKIVTITKLDPLIESTVYEQTIEFAKKNKDWEDWVTRVTKYFM